jgi:hypothetical protein
LTASSYVASLESKLEKLEKRLAALDSRGRPSGDLPPAAPAAAAWRKKRDDDSEIEELVADLGYMCALPSLCSSRS